MLAAIVFTSTCLASVPIGQWWTGGMRGLYELNTGRQWWAVVDSGGHWTVEAIVDSGGQLWAEVDSGGQGRQ
jgi:hypothetical protein